MGREIRMVPPEWVHPHTGTYPNGELRYEPLFDGADLALRQQEWDSEKAKWDAGDFPDYVSSDGQMLPYEEYCGDRPEQSDYMPCWPSDTRTHYMMYETTSEGTPISPAFPTPEELARWLYENGASSFGTSTASYEQWLRVCKGGFAPSMVLDSQGLRSGVESLD